MTPYHILGCASRSKFVGGVPFSQVLGQFLTVRQYRDGQFLCKQSWQDRAVLRALLAFPGTMIQSQCCLVIGQALCMWSFTNWHVIVQAVSQWHWAIGLFHA